MLRRIRSQSLIWKILHEGVCYQERGPAVSAKTQKRRIIRMIKELRNLGYRVDSIQLETESAR